MTWLKYGEDKNRYYSQVNNPTDNVLKKAGIKSWLETCGPTACLNVLDCRGDDVLISCPGEYEPQPEEVLSDCLNDQRNNDDLEIVRGDINPEVFIGGQVPQYLAWGIKKVFGVNSVFEFGVSFEKIKENIKKNIGAVICLKDPGHYIGVIGFDHIMNQLIFNDPWPGNDWPKRYSGRPGYHRKMTKQEFEKNVKDYVIWIG